jgi:hypothetical protein
LASSSVAKTGKVGKQARAEGVESSEEERKRDTREGPPGMMTKAQGEGPPP